VLTVLMERVGHRVASVGNGEEALARLKAGGVDLVLMDAEMPVLDGLAATRALRALPGASARVAVIGVTAHGGEDAAGRFREAGADAVIAKPLDIAELLSAIAAVVGRRA
jgi:CheY-like chemotaxis protein